MFDGTNADEVERFVGDAYETWIPTLRQVVIRTRHGEKLLNPGDWITRDEL